MRFQRIYRAATAVAFVSGAIPASARAQAPVTLTAGQLREDLRFLAETIERVHPAPFHAVSATKFAAAVKSIDRDIPHLSPQQVIARFAGLVALVSDGHTHIQFRDPVFLRQKAFPVRIDRFPDGIHIVAVNPDLSRTIGARVTRIGSLPAEAAWDSLMTIAPGDNVFSRMTSVPVVIAIPEFLSAIGLSTADSLRVTLAQAGSNTEQDVWVHAVSTPRNDSWFDNEQGAPGGATVSALPIDSAQVEFSYWNRNLRYWYSRRGDMLYARVNGIQNSSDTTLLDGTKASVSLEGFFNRIFAAVDSGGIDKLIVDLRYNGGGNNDLALPVVSGIAARPSINQKGHLFVLTGRRTYSAAMNLTSMLEERTEAIFVGEPAGGRPSHYGDATDFTLPNSKARVFVSTLHWTLGVRPTDVRDAQEPGISAPMTFAALKNGRDPALDAVRNYKPENLLSDYLLSVFRAKGLDSTFAAYSRRRSGAGKLPKPWGSDVQQLVSFGYGLLSEAKTRAEIFRAFDWVTNNYPDSPQAWMANGRVHSFVREWAIARSSYERAAALRPNNELILRTLEAAKRK